MSDLCKIELDLDRIKDYLAQVEGRAFSKAEVIAWLEEVGFVRKGRRWIAEAGDLNLLRQSDIISVQSLVSKEKYHRPPVFPFPLSPEIEPPRRTSYVLSESRREELSKLPEYDQLMVPAFMVGLHRDVMRRSQRLFKKVLKDRSWQPALSKEEFVHIDDTPGVLLIHADYSLTDEENLVLYEPNGYVDLMDMYEDKELPLVLRDLMIEGSNSFWFCLGFVCGFGQWLTTGPWPAGETARTARMLWPKILRWWPHFVARNDRFFLFRNLVGWPQWGVQTAMYSSLNWPIDWDYIRNTDPKTAGERFWELWKADQNRLESRQDSSGTD